MKHARIATLAVSVILLAGAALAPAPFLAPNSVDFKAILATAPSEDSQQTHDELQQMLKLQQDRTPQDVARAKSEVKLSPFIFSEVLGSWFNPDDLPETTTFLKRVGRETGQITMAAKVYYHRRRPFVVDDQLKPCVQLEKSLSYPSGHSTAATVWSMVLAEMFPEKRQQLLARGRQVGDDRVLAGVHFPSDVEAGRKLGAAIFTQLMASPDFHAEMDKARQECLAHEHS